MPTSSSPHVWDLSLSEGEIISAERATLTGRMREGYLAIERAPHLQCVRNPVCVLRIRGVASQPSIQQCPVRTGETTRKATVTAVTKLHVGFRSGDSLLLNFSVHPITLLGYPWKFPHTISPTPPWMHFWQCRWTISWEHCCAVSCKIFQNQRTIFGFGSFVKWISIKDTVRSGYFKKC
jgi:hypothetical protein